MLEQTMAECLVKVALAPWVDQWGNTQISLLQQEVLKWAEKHKEEIAKLVLAEITPEGVAKLIAEKLKNSYSWDRYKVGMEEKIDNLIAIELAKIELEKLKNNNK